MAKIEDRAWTRDGAMINRLRGLGKRVARSGGSQVYLAVTGTGAYLLRRLQHWHVIPAKAGIQVACMTTYARLYDCVKDLDSRLRGNNVLTSLAKGYRRVDAL